jgi:hypothetical protein
MRRALSGDDKEVVMRSLSRWSVSFLALSLWSCTPEGTGTSSSSVSCYQTTDGVTCRSTDGVDGLPTDVDGDGEEDAFYCGDTDSHSDEDGSRSLSDDEDDDEDEPEDGDDDEDADESGGCAGSAESDSDSDSDSTVDSEDSEGDDSESDADQDGVADGHDCDCVPPGDDTPPTGEGEPTPVP